jgi:MinD superfamily P-loop ATPase
MPTKSTQSVLPLIDQARCTGCGKCEQLCPTHAIDMRDGRPVIARPADCSFCDVCESYCPEHAIGRPFRIIFATDQLHSDPLDTTGSEQEV